MLEKNNAGSVIIDMYMYFCILLGLPFWFVYEADKGEEEIISHFKMDLCKHYGKVARVAPIGHGRRSYGWHMFLVNHCWYLYPCIQLKNVNLVHNFPKKKTKKFAMFLIFFNYVIKVS